MKPGLTKYWHGALIGLTLSFVLLMSKAIEGKYNPFGFPEMTARSIGSLIPGLVGGLIIVFFINRSAKKRANLPENRRNEP